VLKRVVKQLNGTRILTKFCELAKDMSVIDAKIIETNLIAISNWVR
jgi:hypothetical protein